MKLKLETTKGSFKEITKISSILLLQIKPPFVTSIRHKMYHLSLLSMHYLMVHIPIHHRTVMMNHIPPSIMELKNIGHIEWPCIHVNICSHGNPSHVCQDASAHISNLKIQSLLPVEY
ncbi:hypothetical protein V8G54_002058 [Vigna mungo]|uniref:Uncharacterized protein n=1 Tax=Vigna mungo TaxID=3915 RepID=A0AAQ3S8S0_VIGMU